jgi:hypothetical protein
LRSGCTTITLREVRDPVVVPGHEYNKTNEGTLYVRLGTWILKTDRQFPVRSTLGDDDSDCMALPAVTYEARALKTIFYIKTACERQLSMSSGVVKAPRDVRQ